MSQEGALNITDIRILTKPLVLAMPAEVDAIESKLWVTFPAGYRDYVTKLGEGVLGGSFVRVYPPWRIDKELGDWRRRIGRYWFWESSRELLPKERALECIIVGDTVNGDEMLFHPARPNRLLCFHVTANKPWLPDPTFWEQWSGCAARGN